MTRQSSAVRYEYFIKKVVDQEKLWSLGDNEGWCLASNYKNEIYIPVWPHQEYANLCVKDEWSLYFPKEISLESWLAAWIPGMIRDNRRVAIFPTPVEKGIEVELLQLESDIRTELFKL